MHNVLSPNAPIRYVPPIPGVPDAQARALDRRHRLECQQRSFLEPRRTLPVSPAFGADRSSVIEAA